MPWKKQGTSSSFAALASSSDEEADQEDVEERKEGKAGASGGSASPGDPRQGGQEQDTESEAEAQGARDELRDNQSEDDSEEGSECSSLTRTDIAAIRMDRRVEVRLIPDRGDLPQPALSFGELGRRGVPQALVQSIRATVGGAERPTAIQAECWGALLGGPASIQPDRPPAPAALSRVLTQRMEKELGSLAGLRPEDVPVPGDDDDPELLREDSVAHLVREDRDLAGIAPTGSGKTLAYLLPFVADGLCSSRRPPPGAEEVFAEFTDLFPQSFPTGQGRNDALLGRLRKLREDRDAALWPAVASVAETAARAKDRQLARRWSALRQQCSRVGLVQPTGLVLAPTRELAQQVGQVAAAIGASCEVVLGGVDHEAQRRRLHAECPALIVATPGRLRALCGELTSSARRRLPEGAEEPAAPVAAVTLRNVLRFVLDEGDRLLDEGFEEDILALARMAGSRRLTMLFSATWSSRTEPLRAVMRPALVLVTVAGVPTTISQEVELVPKAARGRRLRDLLREFGSGAKVLVFVLFRREAKNLARMLNAEGIPASALEGNMSQAARTAALQAFRDASAASAGGPRTSPAVLVATDVAARGLDVPDVTHVVNFSLGLSVESYIHRIGRCGRAGRGGTAVTFITDGDERYAGQLLQVLQRYRQPVPPGLKEMADLFDRSGGSTRLTVRRSCAGGGETRLSSRSGH